jgi:hypothetical protein
MPLLQIRRTDCWDRGGERCENDLPAAGHVAGVRPFGHLVGCQPVPAAVFHVGPGQRRTERLDAHLRLGDRRKSFPRRGEAEPRFPTEHLAAGGLGAVVWHLFDAAAEVLLEYDCRWLPIENGRVGHHTRCRVRTP